MADKNLLFFLNDGASYPNFVGTLPGILFYGMVKMLFFVYLDHAFVRQVALSFLRRNHFFFFLFGGLQRAPRVWSL